MMGYPKPSVRYRTLLVKSTDPDEEAEVEQQVIIEWDKISNSSIASDGDMLSIVVTAKTRKELESFLLILSKAITP